MPTSLKISSKVASKFSLYQKKCSGANVSTGRKWICCLFQTLLPSPFQHLSLNGLMVLQLWNFGFSSHCVFRQWVCFFFFFLLDFLASTCPFHSHFLIDGGDFMSYCFTYYMNRCYFSTSFWKICQYVCHFVISNYGSVG